LSLRKGWWKDHDYSRRSVKRDFLSFCGWDTIERIITNNDPEISALVSALFETGGRANEVLNLRPEQFEIRKDVVMVLRMPVNKLRKEGWRTFPISIKDPPMQILLNYIEKIPRSERLFPYRYGWLYKRVSELDKRDGDKHGEWWPHRFRAERATQLVLEKNFDVLDLMKFFGWKRTDTPISYVSLSPTELIKKIASGEI
jgi:integrase